MLPAFRVPRRKLTTDMRPWSPLVSECALESDSRQCTGDRHHGIQVGDLTVRIEEGDQEDAAEGAGDCPRDQFERDEQGAFRAPVMIGEMPSATRTGRHM